MPSTKFPVASVNFADLLKAEGQIHADRISIGRISYNCHHFANAHRFAARYQLCQQSATQTFAVPGGCQVNRIFN